MEFQEKSPTKERNPLTQQVHKREAFWQITIPLIIGAVLFLALATAVSGGAMGKVGTWANIGVIWLILMMFLPGLILLILLAALAFGVSWLIIRLPEYALQVQNFFEMIVWQVTQFSNKTVEPVLRIESTRAKFKAIFHK
jgi:uncharacterized membrane protein